MPQDEQGDTVLIHIGYHKTASSFLQHNVFETDQQLLSAPRGSIRARFLEPGGLDFDSEKTVEWLNEWRDEARAAGRHLILSDEELSGSIHTGGSGGYVTKEVATRLQQVAPDAHILIVIRNQLDLIESAYRQYVKRGGTLPLTKYLTDRGTNYKLPGFRFHHLDYYALVQLYRSLFPAERVHIMTYETLRADPERFLGDLALALGLPCLKARSSTPSNVSSSATSVVLARFTNHFYGRDRLNYGSVFHIPVVHTMLGRLYSRIDGLRFAELPSRVVGLSERNRSRIAQRYRDGNRKLEQLTALPLTEQGYPT